MWFKKKTIKRHEDEPYLIAHVLRGSGSVSSLLHFISTHPGGEDAARRDIIKIKYWYSKCSPVVQNIVRKMVTDFESFDVETENWRSRYYDSDESSEYFEVRDRKTGLRFNVNTDECKIKIPGGDELSKDIFDWTLFLDATRSVMYIKNNIDEMRKSQASERRKQNYMETYK